MCACARISAPGLSRANGPTSACDATRAWSSAECGSDHHIVADHRVEQYAPRPDRATCSNAGLAQQRHARLNHRVLAARNLRIDHHRLRQINRHARGHQLRRLARPENPVHFRQRCARVAARISCESRGHHRLHAFVLRPQIADHIGQIELVMRVVWLQLAQRRPQFLQSEAVNARVYFLNCALFRRRRLFFYHAFHAPRLVANHAPVVGGIIQHRA